MGKIKLYTKEQEIILDELKNNPFLNQHFYFTGGTALSSVYLHHRYSDDLDFFTPEKINQQVIFSFVEEWRKKYHFVIQSHFVEVVYIFNLLFPHGQKLKVDFASYPYQQIEEPLYIDNVRVDSLTDIAINKLLTLSQRTEVKDFVDIYFLLKEFSVWDLITGVKRKFHVEIDPFVLASDFTKAETFDILPRMIQPVSLAALQDFFREKAIELGNKSLA